MTSKPPSTPPTKPPDPPASYPSPRVMANVLAILEDMEARATVQTPAA